MTTLLCSATEDRVREKFIHKGGRPLRDRPHYMILGVCPWMLSWYERGCELRIPLERFSPEILSDRAKITSRIWDGWCSSSEGK